ncbi:MAG: S8 family serine peptidase [Myxococcales bacterium]|nr:S8 family serine peptidase [Myxococcales bacterium]
MARRRAGWFVLAALATSSLASHGRARAAPSLTLQPAQRVTSAPVAPAVESRAVRSPIGAEMLRWLGPHAADALAPSSGLVGALVRIPPGQGAAALGVEEIAPGIGRLRASPSRIDAWSRAHPDIRLEIAPPLHPLMNLAGRWVFADVARATKGATGRGVLVGVADTGLDVTHPDMRDAQGRTRVAWMLDLSLLPIGAHPEVEEKFSVKDDQGKPVAGAVFSSFEIDALLNRFGVRCDEAKGEKCAPSDEIGHGTHVTGIAASTGSPGGYTGIAPEADIVFVRVTRGKSDGIENDDLVRAVQFMFDRADAMKRPMVVNLSLGSDFGPHDGTFLWEQAIASHVGPTKPGRAIVAAAGNSGSVVESPIHQSVRASRGTTMRVPVRTRGSEGGSVQIWVTKRAGADLRIGLDGPDGEWIAPVAEGSQAGKNTDSYNAGVIHGSSVDQSPVPEGSRGAVVVWTGAWPEGTYHVTLEGEGMADLYLQGLGDASLGASRSATFRSGVREGTINLPATHPSIIGVGCTVNRPKWISIGGAEVSLRVPVLDEGGFFSAGGVRDLEEGEVCWFSSAGPTVVGVPKPDISAPGALVISALSRTATPGNPGSVFTNPSCPRNRRGQDDPRCLQIDDKHGIAVGTSMSSPLVAGVVALLMQRDPTLTQESVRALLQAGAHPFRGSSPFFDQSGPGEVDALGALDALEQMQRPELYMPSVATSWLTLSADYLTADGSTPLTAIVELRTVDGVHRADLFDKDRLRPVALVDGKPIGEPVMVRRGPGVHYFELRAPPGLGGRRVTLGATFDGEPIVGYRTVPIAPDGWTAAYPASASGSGCATRPERSGAGSIVGVGLALALLSARRRAVTRPRS